MKELLDTILDNNTYYVLALVLLMIAAFDVGWMIGWIWSSM